MEMKIIKKVLIFSVVLIVLSCGNKQDKQSVGGEFISEEELVLFLKDFKNVYIEKYYSINDGEIFDGLVSISGPGIYMREHSFVEEHVVFSNSNVYAVSNSENIIFIIFFRRNALVIPLGGRLDEEFLRRCCNFENIEIILNEEPSLVYFSNDLSFK